MHAYARVPSLGHEVKHLAMGDTAKKVSNNTW